ALNRPFARALSSSRCRSTTATLLSSGEHGAEGAEHGPARPVRSRHLVGVAPHLRQRVGLAGLFGDPSQPILDMTALGGAKAADLEHQMNLVQECARVACEAPPV